MQCSQCGEREAVVHLTQIANDQVVTLHLCERCAAEKGVESSASLSKSPIGGFLASLGPGLAEQPGEAVPCPRCGGTLANFRDTGRLGCPECYRAFEGSLRELLRRLHGSTRHLGERYAAPGGGPDDGLPSEFELREQLRLAIETENFELAAELRDRLRSAGVREGE
ncbi:MAG: UvrB/UvrC motif-containing protein [Gemmatimonadales bacterium]